MSYHRNLIFCSHGRVSCNLRSYPPSLYLDAGKEGMIHLLVGSYVKKPDSVFFSDWSRNSICGLWFAVFWLAVIFQQDFRPEAVRKPNGSDEASFCEDEFSFEALMNFNYNSLKAECCSGEDVLAIKFSQRVSWKPQRCWNVSELFTKTKTVKIYFVALLLGSPRSCSWYYPSPSVDPLGEFSWSRLTVFKLLARSWLSR